MLAGEVSKDERPKIGLCLSGGAAKGLAYIPLLEKIDSLGIRIDYITGTSIGALVGGLYAIGYSGKDLRQIANEMEWDYVLTDNLPMYKVNMEEKDEYGRYMLELNLKTFKPELPLGLIQGQNIMRKLNDLTFRAAHIHDFSDLPIPFKCVATDIVTNKPVLLDKGDLSVALRASMSLPTIFSPLDTANMILVDGGMVKNFPVEYVREMGADFVIGGNTSGTLYKKKQLNSFYRIFEQMTSFSIADDYNQQKGDCDLLIDYTAALDSAGLGSADFARGNEILAIGDSIANLFLPQLEKLAASQKNYEIEPICLDILNMSEFLPVGKVRINLDKMSNFGILGNKIQIQENVFVSRKDINKSVERIYGTRFFDKVYYYLEPGDDDYNLTFKTLGNRRIAYKIGLHYDNEISAGILLNFTYRTVRKFASRTIVTFDISDNPKARLGYQIYFGESGWWFNTNHLFERVNQYTFFNRKALGYYNQLYYLSSGSLNKTFGLNTLLSLGSSIEWMNLSSNLVGQQTISGLGQDIEIKRFPYLNLHGFIRLSYNNLDRPYYPKKGKLFQAELKAIPWGKSNIGLEVKIPDGQNVIILDSSINFNFGSYFKISGNYHHSIPVHKKVSLILKANAGMTFLLSPEETDYIIPLQDAYYLGGVDQRERERTNIIPYWGNRELYVQTLNFASVSVSVQAEPFKNILIIPRFSMLLYDDGNPDFYGDKGFISNFKNVKPEFSHSEGATIAYNSPIGPIQFNLSKASNTPKLRGYISIGYRF